jgi:cation:H+ antiporter
MTLFWIIVFIVSLATLVKGADWLLISAERIGLKFGLSPFIVGITIVGMGTSLPELLSGIVATARGVSEIAAATAVGSNISNILVVIGVMAVLGRRIQVEEDLIDLDLPLLALSTVLFGVAAYDKVISFGEALVLLTGFAVYLGYTATSRTKKEIEEAEAVVEAEVADKIISPRHRWWQPAIKRYLINIDWKDTMRLIMGITALAIGANYVIEATVELGSIFAVPAGVIALLAVAFGTSLPETVVSFKAIRVGKGDVALGNILGSCVFNLLLVVGLSTFFGAVTLDSQTFNIGLPMLGISTFVFVVSGISRRIHAWEGALYLLLYVLFLSDVVSTIQP